ncbi:MAE_28990/MAE_18760 family HEPN-like nuclease [Moraxella sp.]|uniref:MAE_28990/MAE_18760 family HEPN-like nuclease n=1 Tax=Moraxella sp. TaxID=479 RepID=UPI0026DC97FC|nr:MAE_28990/MAE_18760 family HEPN-like nuclease [Moraxella sp.]MDO4894022.1 MAE_28990/MAE_18760 family HEPN-like nuclease [Moraxella sp.]
MSYFNTKIEELILETESNIYDLEKMIFSGHYNFLNKDFKILSKQSVVILYSFWEGFIQDAFNIFLKEVDGSINTYFELNNNFMVYQIEKKFPQFEHYPQNNKKKFQFHESYFGLLVEKKHNIQFNVDLKNNVGLEVLNNLLEVHGITIIKEHWKEKGYSHPNLTVKQLLNKILYIRNNTAHGNKVMTNVIIEQVEFEQYKRLIIDLMHELGKLFIECINNKNYLKSS